MIGRPTIDRLPTFAPATKVAGYTAFGDKVHLRGLQKPFVLAAHAGGLRRHEVPV